MSVQKSQFDYEGAHHAPSVVDYERVVKYDEKAEEVVVYSEVDYPSLTKSLGKASDWTLESMMAAGVPINQPIHTGSNSRIEVASAVDAVAVEVESVFSKSSKS